MSTLAVTLPTLKTPGWGYTNLARALGADTAFIAALPPTDISLPISEYATLDFLNGALLNVAVLPTGLSLEDAMLTSTLLPPLAASHQLNVAAGTSPITLRVRHFFSGAPTPNSLPVSGGGLKIQLAPGATFTLLESFVSLDEQPIWACPVLQLALAEGAHLHHAVVQTLNAHSTLTVSQQGMLADTARYHRTLVQSGGALARYESTLTLGAKTDCQLHGLHLTGAHQLHDTTATLHFIAPGSTANVRQRNVLAGDGQQGGHGVFQGTFKVAQAAQKTDAFMRSETLLLSPAVRLDQKPELEIFADDVKCSHGASSSAIDENALFYLQARGLDYATAQGLLVGGFAKATLENAVSSGALPADGLAFVEAALNQWLEAGTHEPA